MTELVLAVLVFLATHALPALKPLRAALTDRLGERAYMILYSLLSVVVLVWLGVAYVRAPYLEVWPYAPWSNWVTVAVMPLACVLLVAAVSAPNPLSVGLGSRGYSPDRPGIVSVTRHPLMWGFALWAAAHLPPNGDLASLILFGVLLGLSLAGPPSLDAKRRATLGEARWRELAGATSSLPFAAIVAGRTRLDLAGIGVARLACGLALYAVLLFGHAPVLGISPLPG